jgi:hypothetical protein
MLMRSPLQRHGRQLHLFQKEPEGPSWQSLSAETKQTAIELLAQLLCRHRDNRQLVQIEKRASGE